MAPRVVLDWDGTVTETDGLHLVILEFGDVAVFESAERRLGADLTLHEAIELEIRSIRAPLAEVVAWVRERVRVRPGFAEFAHAYRPLIVSSGFHELIDPVLEREGVELEVRANRLDPRPNGWRGVFRDTGACGVCGEPCKRRDVSEVGRFVYVGDGVSDDCVALAARRVFARDELARFLAERGVAFEPFHDFVALGRRLGDPTDLF